MKRFLSFLLICSLLFLFSACGGENGEAAAAVTLTDAAGRVVRLEKPAERIVSCYYISTSAVISLGMKDRLVGIEKKAETRPIYAMTDEALLSLPQVGSMKELNVEAIAALQPDLILLPMKCASYAETFDELGLNTLIVDPEDGEGLRQMLALIGTACGKEAAARAGELTSAADTLLRKAASHTDTHPAPRVLMTGNSSFLTAAPDGMYQSTMIAQAGGINAAAELSGNYWTEISFESILAMDPEVVILPSDAAYGADDLISAFRDAGLPLPDALKNGRIYQMPGCLEAWDSPVPSSVLGVLWLNTVLYGNSDSFDFPEEVKTFYETFCGFAVDEALLTGLIG